MNEELRYPRRRVLRAAGLVALVAAVLTVLVILPAEFGRDPTGFGRVTGLTRLAATRAAAVEAGAAPLAEWAHGHDERYASGRYQVQLGPYEETEYKATLARGEPLLYRWSVREGSAVHYEFHGEPTEGQWPKDYYESYALGEGGGGQGSMVAPFTGHHGWYWVNLSDQPVTIEVELVGYYSAFGPVTAPTEG